MPRELHDHYFKMAKKEGYLARAAYKLLEINERRRVFRRGQNVLDFGSAPGSWLQVASKKVAPSGNVVGVDLSEVHHTFCDGNVTCLVDDVFTMKPDVALAALPSSASQTRGFDVVLSDMAPKTTGDAAIDHHGSIHLCDAVLDHCYKLLIPGGTLVMKVFEGEASPDLMRRVRACFDHTKGFKPKASRSDSREMYIIASGYTNEPIPPQAQALPPIPKMPSGWGS